MWVDDPPWNNKTKLTDLDSPPTTFKINFAEDTICERKPWEKWTAIYWFTHQAYSAVIPGWIPQSMKRLRNWWLSDSEIRLLAIPYLFHPITPYIFLCFTYCFPSFFGHFPCFPWCFSLCPILSLAVANFLQITLHLLIILLFKTHVSAFFPKQNPIQLASPFLQASLLNL